MNTIAPLVSKLRTYAPLTEEEEAVLEGVPVNLREFNAGEDMVAQGTEPSASTLLLSGFSARYNLSVDGKRQFTAVQVTGDFVDLHSFLLKPMDHSIQALTDCKVALVPHSVLEQLTNTHPRLTRLLWLSTLIDGAAHRKWAVCLGSLRAHQHLAHILCELYVRLEQVGQAENHQLHAPFTQATLGECLALSSVHTNRVVQMLRTMNLIRWEKDLVSLLDWNGLVALSEFDLAYLKTVQTAA